MCLVVVVGLGVVGLDVVVLDVSAVDVVGWTGKERWLETFGGLAIVGGLRELEVGVTLGWK